MELPTVTLSVGKDGLNSTLIPRIEVSGAQVNSNFVVTATHVKSENSAENFTGTFTLSLTTFLQWLNIADNTPFEEEMLTAAYMEGQGEDMKLTAFYIGFLAYTGWMVLSENVTEYKFDPSLALGIPGMYDNGHILDLQYAVFPHDYTYFLSLALGWLHVWREPILIGLGNSPTLVNLKHSQYLNKHMEQQLTTRFHKNTKNRIIVLEEKVANLEAALAANG